MFVHKDKYAEYMNKSDEELCPDCGGSLELLAEDGVYKCTSCSFWVEEDCLEDAWIEACVDEYGLDDISEEEGYDLDDYIEV